MAALTRRVPRAIVSSSRVRCAVRRSEDWPSVARGRSLQTASMASMASWTRPMAKPGDEAPVPSGLAAPTEAPLAANGALLTWLEPELASLAASGIPFQIVPGITAASGCASYAGIPLTHRDYSQSVRFLTGHTKDGKVPLEWDILVKEQKTLDFYMGLAGLPLICDQLIKH